MAKAHSIVHALASDRITAYGIMLSSLNVTQELPAAVARRAAFVSFSEAFGKVNFDIHYVIL